MAERRFQLLELSAEQQAAFLDRLRPGQVVGEEDFKVLRGLVTGVAELMALIEQRSTTLRRLRH